MKRKINIFAILVIVGYFIPTILNGQITMTRDNFPKPGDSVRILGYEIPPTQQFTPQNYKTADTLTVERTLEKALEANNANDPMKGLTKHSGNKDVKIDASLYKTQRYNPYVRKYVDYSSSLPGAANFPTANVCTEIPTQEGKANLYLLINENGYYDLGFFTVTSQGQTVSKNVPMKPIMKFPLEMGDNVTNAKITSSVNAGLSNMITNTTLNVVVDGYGKIEFSYVDKSTNKPVTIKYDNYLRVVTTSIDTINMSAIGMTIKMFITSKFYEYYVPGLSVPLASYGVSQYRNDMDPQVWSLNPALAPNDKLSFTWSKPAFTAGISEIEEQFFNIFPNPTDGLVRISFEKLNNEKISVEVYDLAGKLLQTHEAVNKVVEFDMSNLPSGTYIVNLKINDYSFKSKIVKK